MLRGLYTSASGMLVETMKTDVIANNLANVHTYGFKKQIASTRSFPDLLLHRINDPASGFPGNPRPTVGRLGTGAAIDELTPDMTAGPLEFTGRPLDLALLGPGFLAVLLPGGETAYTRDGRLEIDGEGYIVGTHGGRILGSQGPIQAEQGDVIIDEDANVWVDGEMVDGLVIVEFENPQALERLGSNMLAAGEFSGEAGPAATTTVRSHYLERANVVIVKEMVQLIATERAYEANQRMITAHDETLGRLINEASKVS